MKAYKEKSQNRKKKPLTDKKSIFFISEKIEEKVFKQRTA